MFDHTLELTREVEREVRDFFGEIVYQTVIPRDVAVCEAPSHGLLGDRLRPPGPRSAGLRGTRHGGARIVTKQRQTRTRPGSPAWNDHASQPTGEWNAPLAGENLVKVNVCVIDANPYQPRREFDEAELGQLAESIKEHGMLQPILVRRAGERYQLIAGERRLRAAIKAGLAEVPAQIKQADDREMAELAIVENLQRRDLNAAGKGGIVPAVPGALRVHAGRAGRPAEDRPLDDRQPDPPAGAARAGAGRRAARSRSRRDMPARCCRWATSTSRCEFCQRIQAEGLSVRATEAAVQELVRAADSRAAGALRRVWAAHGQAAQRAPGRRWSRNSARRWARRST